MSQAAKDSRGVEPWIQPPRWRWALRRRTQPETIQPKVAKESMEGVSPFAQMCSTTPHPRCLHRPLILHSHVGGAALYTARRLQNLETGANQPASPHPQPGLHRRDVQQRVETAAMQSWLCRAQTDTDGGTPRQLNPSSSAGSRGRVRKTIAAHRLVLPGTGKAVPRQLRPPLPPAPGTWLCRRRPDAITPNPTLLLAHHGSAGRGVAEAHPHRGCPEREREPARVAPCVGNAARRLPRGFAQRQHAAHQPLGAVPFRAACAANQQSASVC
jgi:hypothetical protein